MIGIVASRLCERFHRPAILFAEKDGVLVGSGRSPDGIDLYAVLTGLSRYFTRYGGHARAAGITMPAENFTAFQADFLQVMDGYEESRFEPAYGYEEKLSLPALSLSQVKELAGLAPFGEGNPEPVYLLENAVFSNASRMGKDGAHLSATVRAEGRELRLVAFRQGPDLERFQRGTPVDLLARPSINRFRDRESLELYFEAAATGAEYRKVFRAILLQLMYNGSGSEDALANWLRFTRDLIPLPLDRGRMAGAYRSWRTVFEGAPVSVDALADCNGAEALAALPVFLELGFFVLDDTGAMRVAENAPARNLMESKLFCALQNGENF